jgi:hypothetical protein
MLNPVTIGDATLTSAIVARLCRRNHGRVKMQIENGKVYVNGRGDILGPMDERVLGVFLDQHGGVYRPDGRQWDHAEGSTANLIAETDKMPEPRTAP